MRDYLAGRVQQTVVSPVPQPAPQPAPQQAATQPWQPAPHAYQPAPQPRRQPAPRYTPPPPLAAPQRERRGFGFGTLLLGLLLLGGLITLAYLALNTDLGDWLGGGGVVPGATQTPAPTQTPEPDATPVPVVALPNFVGQSEADVLNQMEQLGLRRRVDPEDQSLAPRFSTEYPRGAIMEQRPAPGTEVPRGSEIDIVVSLGPQIVDVPDVARLRFSDAQAQLVAAGFNVERQDQPSTSVQEGFVISQNPQGGVRLPQGETITVAVSAGDVVAFPDVVANGTLRDAAVSQIQAAGFTIVAEDVQGRDVLGAQFDRFQPNEIVSATANDIPIDVPRKLVPRGANVVIAIRAP
jgi:eukaryotic-like serine/threonine-protein kinase